MNRIKRFFSGKAGQPETLAHTASLPGCPNCGAALQGHYCSNCGQKKEDKHDMTILHFVGHSLHEFTHFDSRFFRSIKYLMFRPGFLVEEFIAGRRKKYINPIRLFILVNVFYFIFVAISGNNTLSTPLAYYEDNKQQKQMVEEKIKQASISYNKYEEIFNEHSIGMGKSLVIIMVPMFALVTALLFYRQKRYAVEHLAFSLSLFSMLMLILSLGILALILMDYIIVYAGFKPLILLHVISRAQAIRYLNFLTDFFQSETNVLSIFVIAIFPALFVALKRVFRESNRSTLIKSIICAAAVSFILLIVYRNILFYATFYTLKIPH